MPYGQGHMWGGQLTRMWTSLAPASRSVVTRDLAVVPRTMMSAPIPRARRCESSESPWLSPTSESTSVTGTPMSSTVLEIKA